MPTSIEEILVLTWNVADQRLLLPPLPHKKPIIVIGLQEIDMSAESLLIGETQYQHYWKQQFKVSNYECILSKQLSGLLLMVFSTLGPQISIGEVDTKTTGFVSLGNKGSICATVKVGESKICFINSHFAADANMVQRRNWEYQVCKAQFKNQLDEADHVVWFGDLNYRLSLPDAEVRSLLKSIDDYEQLLVHCQLRCEMDVGGAFSDYEEKPIEFQPSYKYDIGTKDTFDTSEKKRVPSWCDRILHRKGSGIKVLEYSSIMDVTTSDHKPVYQVLQVDIEKIDFAKQAMETRELLKQLNKQENDSIPDVTISTNHLDYGQVQYNVPVPQTVTLKNVGLVAAKVSFIAPFNLKIAVPPFLQVHPSRCTIKPGEKQTLTLTCCLDSQTTAALNTSRKLDHILILHIDNGRDMFITLQASFVPTCICMDIVTLCSLKDVTVADAFRNGQQPQKSQQSPSIPKEIWRVVDYLYKNALGMDTLFLVPGDALTVREIIKCLDTGEPFIPTSEVLINSMAEVLVDMLTCLPVPVIPDGFVQRCIDATSTQQAKGIIGLLPKAHQELFNYVTSFLRQILSALPPKKESSSQLDADKLAMLFSNALLGQRVQSQDVRFMAVLSKKKASFLMLFLVK